MKLIVFRCANGYVTFESLPRPTYQGIIVRCMNDGSVGRLPLPPLSNVAAAFARMQVKAIALAGAVQQVMEIEL